MHQTLRRFAASCALVLAGALTAQQWEDGVRPCARGYGGYAFDPLRGVTVLFGGRTQTGGRVFADTWERGAGAWRRLQPLHVPPLRFGAGMAFDPVQGRVILFGGSGDFRSSVWLSDTWSFDGVDWTQLTPAASPPRRAFPAMATDTVRGRIVLFLADTFPPHAETWTWNGSNWQAQVPSVSPPSTGVMAMHAGLGKLLLFTSDGSGALSTWTWDGAQWQQLAPATTPPRVGSALATTPSGDVLMFGGFGTTAPHADSWLFDGIDWRLQTVPAPSARAGHGMVLDTVRNRIVLHGSSGGIAANGMPNNHDDTWEYDGVQWQAIDGGEAPAFGVFASGSFDPRTRTVTITGMPPLVFTSTMWQLQNDAWQQLSSAVLPTATANHAIAFDHVRGIEVLFGGNASGLVVAETWERTGTTWVQRTPPVSPSARSDHAMAWDSRRRRVVLFGGGTLATPLADTWSYAQGSWTQLAVPHAPAPRWHAAMGYDSANDRMVLFGGFGNVNGRSGDFADTWLFDGADWREVVTQVRPMPRLASLMTFDPWRARMVLVGCAATPVVGDEVWEFDGQLWREVPRLPGSSVRVAVAAYADPDTATIGIVGRDGERYRVAPLPIAQWVRHGTGCSGSAGTPQLDVAANATPSLGSTTTIQLTALPPQPGLAFVVAGLGIAQWNGALLPFDLAAVGVPGCLLWVEPQSVFARAHGGTSLALPFAVPAQPALAGAHCALQAFVLDGAAVNGVAAVSNALAATVW